MCVVDIRSHPHGTTSGHSPPAVLVIIVIKGDPLAIKRGEMASPVLQVDARAGTSPTGTRRTYDPRYVAVRRWMQVAGIDAFGGDVHMLELAAPGSPAPDELVISVRAAGVGNWDEVVRVGDWDVGRKPRLALGVEAAGVVAAVGEQVTRFALGDEVLTHPVPLRHQGTWAELLLAPAALVARKPAAVPWETAAAFPVPALTADQAPSVAAQGTFADSTSAGRISGGPANKRSALAISADAIGPSRCA